MKKVVVLGMGLCVALAFSSCKSSESAYKKAYEKAKQQELAEAATNETPEETTVTPVAPVAPVTTTPAPAPTAPVREEKVELVSGDGLKAYSVVCGSFGIKANADGLKAQMDGEGYNAKVVYNGEKNISCRSFCRTRCVQGEISRPEGFPRRMVALCEIISYSK